jgi:hypothetical protein
VLHVEEFPLEMRSIVAAAKASTKAVWWAAHQNLHFGKQVCRNASSIEPRPLKAFMVERHCGWNEVSC